jgi:hypothetical protein
MLPDSSFSSGRSRWDPRTAWPAVAAVLVAFAVGTFLRVQQLRIQWLTDDEWHAVERLQTTEGYRALFGSFGIADFSIPLALLYRAVAQTIGLGEFLMRLPMLVCGLLTLVLGTLWAWRRLSPGVAAFFAAFLAVSPLLVNYSRNARPYAITLLLDGVAILALARWDAARSPWPALAYAAASWLAIWLHQASAPFLLMPLVYLFVRDVARAVRGGEWQRARQTFVLGLAVGAALAAVLVPPLASDPAALGTRTGQDLPQLATLVGALRVWTGTGSAIVVAGFVALAIAGAPVLWRALRPEATLWLVGLAATLAAVLVTRPAWSQHALTFARYLLPALPLLLLAAAAGSWRLVAAVPSPWLAAPAAAALALGALVGTPHAALLQRPNNFTLHSYHQFDYRHEGNPTRAYIDAIPTSPFWQRLATQPPGSLRVAVAGHGLESYYIGDVRWQPIHRQRLFNAELGGYCVAPMRGEGRASAGIRFANAVTLAEPGWARASGIDLLVWKKLHRSTTPDYVDLAPCADRMRRDFGPPAFEDDQVMVFDLSGRLR